MLWILAAILFLGWLVGLKEDPLAGFIHVLLFLALLAATTDLLLRWRRRRYEQLNAEAEATDDDPDLSLSA